MKRRTFIAGLGSAAVWPVVARAQQKQMPVIGYLGVQSADDDYTNVTFPFHQGLKDTGYVEGRSAVGACSRSRPSPRRGNRGQRCPRNAGG